MSKEILLVVEAVSNEKDVPEDVIFEAIEAALLTLPDDFRIPVVLRDVADLDYQEIATTLGVPVGTVKSRIARGRGMLANALTPRPGNHDPGTRRPTEAP